MGQPAFSQYPVEDFLNIPAGREIAGTGANNQVIPDLMMAISIQHNVQASHSPLSQRDYPVAPWILGRRNNLGVMLCNTAIPVFHVADSLGNVALT